MSYSLWERYNFKHLSELFEIFRSSFEETLFIDWDSSSLFEEFCKLIYKHSTVKLLLNEYESDLEDEFIKYKTELWEERKTN